MKAEGDGFTVGILVTGLGVGTSALAGQNVDRAGTRLLCIVVIFIRFKNNSVSRQRAGGIF